MAAERLFDRQQALRRLTRVLLLLSALGALGRAMRGIFAARRLDGAGSRLSLAERQLLNVVNEMALAASVPVPDVYLADDAAINTFALEKAGRCRVDKPNRPARQAAFMMFVSPYRDRFWLVRTHPRVDRRIAAVRRMAPQSAGP